jgi:hypothetical protein
MRWNAGKVNVVRVSKTGYVDKQGRRKDYSSAYLRRTYHGGLPDRGPPCGRPGDEHA